MQTTTSGRKLVAAMMLSALVTSPALADKPEWAGGEKGERHGRHEQRGDDERGHSRGRDSDRDRDQRGPGRNERRDNDHRHDRDHERYERYSSGTPSIAVYVHFGEPQRHVVHEYYRESYRHGRCPPGLAKKNNGCMPPGLAKKKWSRGRPLPRDVIFYDVPRDLVIRLGAPPRGHRYVRVAADILLIAIGTGMVVDAIEDLSRL